MTEFELAKNSRFFPLMGQYTTDHLVNVSPSAFQQYIEGLEGQSYEVDERQYSYETDFRWGHDHDFGTFFMDGQMGSRHILALDDFERLGATFEGHVLDVGCWTGGASLILRALGCDVVAIDEVGHYPEALKYMAHAFGIPNPNLKAYHMSLYNVDFGSFDRVLCAGVIYHLSDMLRGLRAIFEALRDGGEAYIECEIDKNAGECEILYKGIRLPGWRWFVPSPNALCMMMEDVGFEILAVETRVKRSSVLAKRNKWVNMTRAGTWMR